MVKDVLTTEGQASSIGSRCSGEGAAVTNGDEGGSIHRKVHCSYKINPVAEMFSKMKGHKEQLLGAMSFRGLMSLPMIETNAVKSVNRQLGFWLLMRLDGETGVLALGRRGRILITEQDVSLVTGLQCVGHELIVSDQSGIETIKERIKVILMLDERDVLDLESISRVLDRDLPEDSGHLERNAFIVAAAIYAVSYFLAPKGRPPRINTEILEALQDPANVFRINWASYVLRTLKECSNKVKSDVRAQSKTVTLEGCLLVLQIAYLDNLNFGEFSTTHTMTPRVKSFTKEIMDRLTNMDKIQNAVSQDCKFGKTEIRHASESIYSWGCGRIDMLRALNETYEINKLLDDMDNCNDEHIKRLRSQQRDFAEQQLRETKQYHDKIKAMVKKWGARIEIRMGKMVDEDVNNIVNSVITTGRDIAHDMVALERRTTTTDNMVTLCALATNGQSKGGRTKHVAPRKRIEKRKRGAQESWSASAGENGEAK